MGKIIIIISIEKNWIISQLTMLASTYLFGLKICIAFFQLGHFLFQSIQPARKN